MSRDPTSKYSFTSSSTWYNEFMGMLSVYINQCLYNIGIRRRKEWMLLFFGSLSLCLCLSLSLPLSRVQKGVCVRKWHPAIVSHQENEMKNEPHEWNQHYDMLCDVFRYLPPPYNMESKPMRLTQQNVRRAIHHSNVLLGAAVCIHCVDPLRRSQVQAYKYHLLHYLK